MLYFAVKHRIIAHRYCFYLEITKRDEWVGYDKKDLFLFYREGVVISWDCWNFMLIIVKEDIYIN